MFHPFWSISTWKVNFIQLHLDYHTDRNCNYCFSCKAVSTSAWLFGTEHTPITDQQYHSAHCIVHTAQCKLHHAQCKLHTAQCTLHSAQCTLNTSKTTLYSTHYKISYLKVPKGFGKAQPLCERPRSLFEGPKPLFERLRSLFKRPKNNNKK